MPAVRSVAVEAIIAASKGTKPPSLLQRLLPRRPWTTPWLTTHTVDKTEGRPGNGVDAEGNHCIS